MVYTLGGLCLFLICCFPGGTTSCSRVSVGVLRRRSYYKLTTVVNRLVIVRTSGSCEYHVCNVVSNMFYVLRTRLSLMLVARGTNKAASY